MRIRPDLTVRIESRRGRRWTGAFPELAGIGRTLGRSAVLDGETVVMGEGGRPNFGLLSGRLQDRRRPAWAAGRSPATFVAFDVLELDGEPVTELAWSERRQLLVDLPLDGTAAVPTMVCDDGDALFTATERLGVEGVVAKRRTSRYVCGRRTSAWVKVKHKGCGWFDVAGWRLATRSRPAGGILLADEGQPVGTALCCLPADQRAVLHDFLARHGTRYPDVVQAPAGAQVHVEFLKRSATGIVREAVARRLCAAAPS